MAFDCLEIAHEAVRSIAPLIARIERHDRGLADQIRRAIISVPSNIDEGRGAIGKQQAQYYRIAVGSAREVGTQLRIAVAFGWLEDVAAPLALLDRVRAMLWRLTH